MKKLLLAAAFCLFSPAAWAQCTGIFPNNTLCGNTTGSPAPPQAVSTPVVTSSQFDIAFCNSVGYMLARFVSLWACANGIPVNVTFFGAVGDGATDNTTFIANAITAANTRYSGAGHTGTARIYFPPGIYIAQQVSLTTVPNGWTLSGDGAGATILRWKASSAVSNFITIGTSASNQSNMTIEDLTVDGNGSNENSGNTDCIRIGNVQQVKASNIEVMNCPVNGIEINDYNTNQFAAGMLMTNSQVHGWGTTGTGNGILVGRYNFYLGLIDSLVYTGPAGTAGNSAVAGLFVNTSANPVVVEGSNFFTSGPSIIVNNSSIQVVGSSFSNVSSQSAGIVGSAMIFSNLNNNNFVGLQNIPIGLNNTSNYNNICGNVVNQNSVATSLAVQEDATSKPNVYCGASPGGGNTFDGRSGGSSFTTAKYSVNGPTPGPGNAGISGCTAGSCTGSTDFAGTFTTSTNITSATVNFGSHWQVGPACIIATSVSSPQAQLTTATSASMVVGFSAALSSATVSYNCTGTQ